MSDTLSPPTQRDHRLGSKLHLLGRISYNRSRTFYALTLTFLRARTGRRYRKDIVECTIARYINSTLPGLITLYIVQKMNAFERYRQYIAPLEVAI